MYHGHVQLKTRTARIRHNQRGYSLADALVGTVLGLTTMAAVLGLYRVQLYGLRGQTAQLDVQTTARNIVQLVVSEIRRAGGDPRCVKTFEGLPEAKRDRLRIVSDLDGSGAIDAAGEDVTYSLASGVLSRTAGGNMEPLSDSTVKVTDLQFRYYDANGTELNPGTSGLTATQRAQVQRIRVTITVQRAAVDPTSPLALAATAASSADLRNRFFVNKVGCT
ncbi:MAG: hypothetical protein N3C12_04990 [Candidatus Binatia bacterium]|nr:hypothetical protein [Candidatus Binatia bacterium]